MAYLRMFFIFFKIGLFTIGGGYAMIPLIRQELFYNNLMTMDEIVDIIAISEMTPGPFAVNAATFAGMKLLSVPGAIVCTLGVIGPSVIIMSLVARFFFDINKKPSVQAALYGIRPAVWALILYATLTVAYTALTIPGEEFGVDIACVLLFAAVFLCMRFVKKISPIAFIFGAGVLGALFMR